MIKHLYFFFFISLVAFGQKNDIREIDLLESIKISENDNSRLKQYDTLIQFYLAVNVEKASGKIQNIQAINNTTKSNKAKALSDLLLAEYYLYTENLISFSDKIEELKSQSNFLESTYQHRFHLCLIQYFILKNDFTNAKLIALRNAKQVNRIRKYRYIAENSLAFSRIYTADFQKDSALYFASLATSQSLRSDTRLTTLMCLHQQAVSHFIFEEWDKAAQKELQCISLAKKNSDRYFEFRASLLLSIISTEIGNFDETFIFAKKATVLAKERNDKFGLSSANLILAGYYLQSKEFTKAQELLEENKSVIENYPLSLAALNYSFFSSNKLALSNRQREAINILNQLIIRCENAGNDVLKLKSMLLRGQLNMQLKNYEAAKIDFENIDQFLSDKGLVTVRFHKVWDELANYNEQTKKLHKALQFREKYIRSMELNSTLKTAAFVQQLIETELREEREKVIQNQKESISQKEREQEVLRLKTDRQLFLAGIFIVLIVLAFVVLAFQINQQRLKMKQRSAELSQSLLRTQMNPHFIFNAMSVIQSSIYSNEPAKSSKFLVNFSKLMRLILENSPKEFISIELEKDILEKYLFTQKMRFENRFKYKIEIEEELLFKNAMLPPMITQPFVENAIEHGQLHLQEHGMIQVLFKEVNGMLQIQVIDNGVGRSGAKKTQKLKAHKSMAMEITNERIQLLNRKYRTNGKLEVHDLNENQKTGTVITIELPLYFESIKSVS